MLNIIYKNLSEDEINIDLFSAFIRRQVVNKCRRRENGKWVIKDDPFIDDWSRDDYKYLVSCLKNTAATGGLVCGAYYNGLLKGFVSVESEMFGGDNKYLDLTSIHVSEDLRGNGIGKCLFAYAKGFAKQKGAKKLYISAHSAIETQEFYRKTGCVEAKEYNKRHVEIEPFDCQLECEV